MSRGPNHWGELKPEFAPCKDGHRQSPIDIRNPQKSNLPAIQFDYKPSTLSIVDNGHTVMINYSPGSFITVGGKRYELKQFHFHRPSEEKINGKSYEMVVHLVHIDEKGKGSGSGCSSWRREKTTPWSTHCGRTCPRKSAVA